MPSMKLKMFITPRTTGASRVLHHAQIERAHQRQRQMVDRRPGGHRDRRRHLARPASEGARGSRSGRRAGRLAAHTQAPSRIACARPPSDGFSSSTGTATATNIATPPPNGIGRECAAGSSCGGRRDRRARRRAPPAASARARARRPCRTRRARPGGPGSRARLDRTRGQGVAARAERPHAHDDAPAPWSRHGQAHGRSWRSPMRGPRHDAAVAQQRHGDARGVARAHAHDDLAQPALQLEREHARAGLLGRRRDGGRRPELDRPDVGRADRARIGEEVGRRREGRIRAVEQQRARCGGRALASRCGLPMTSVAVQAWPTRRRCARCGCGRTSRAAARPCC